MAKKLFKYLLCFWLLSACTLQTRLVSPTPPPTKPGADAPVMGAPIAELPTPESTPLPPIDLPDGASVQQLLLFSHNHWHSLWADALLVYFAGDDSNQPVQTIRSQLWISLPSQARLISGSAGGAPSTLWVSDGTYYQDNGSQVEPLPPYVLEPFSPPVITGDTIYPHTFGGMLGAPLSDMFFPTSLAQRGGHYTIIGKEIFANREAVVVTWSRESNGAVIDRFWVDARTGVILRWQNFGKPGGQALSTEMYVTAISFEVTFPEQAFFVGSTLPAGFANNQNDLPMANP